MGESDRVACKDDFLADFLRLLSTFSLEVYISECASTNHTVFWLPNTIALPFHLQFPSSHTEAKVKLAVQSRSSELHCSRAE